MKKVVVSLLLLTMFVSCNTNEQKKEEKQMLEFGPKKVQIDQAISVDDMLKQMESAKEEKYFTIEGTINEVCSKAGCWINIEKPGGETFMVRFKDHFTIPTKTEVGTKAYFSGNAYWDTIPVDMLKHFAEDAGDSQEEIDKITEPKFELGFEADGITFEKPAQK